MEKCFRYDPAERPTFEEICQMLAVKREEMEEVDCGMVETVYKMTNVPMDDTNYNNVK